jgi:hypothetical protein
MEINSEIGEYKGKFESILQSLAAMAASAHAAVPTLERGPGEGDRAAGRLTAYTLIAADAKRASSPMP